jgi:hypothetical protein
MKDKVKLQNLIEKADGSLYEFKDLLKKSEEKVESTRKQIIN